MYRMGQVLRRKNGLFRVYKIQENKTGRKIFAESEDHISIICINRPNFLQLVK